jgi:hypothetical protein
MGGFKMPRRGESAQMLQDLNAEHAPHPAGEDSPVIETKADGENEATLQRYNVTTNEETVKPAKERTKERTQKPTGQRTNVVSKHRTPEPVAEEISEANGERERRYATAIHRAHDDEIAVVTVRVSAKLNDYMDRYVERINRLQPKRRYRKQDAVAEAFAAFYAEHPLPTLPEADEEL